LFIVHRAHGVRNYFIAGLLALLQVFDFCAQRFGQPRHRISSDGLAQIASHKLRNYSCLRCIARSLQW
jgi:hypothetical protein